MCSYAAANKALGDIVKVTPSSKVIFVSSHNR
jgi:pyruvate carboxylase